MTIDFFQPGTQIKESLLSIERLARINKALKIHPCYAILGYQHLQGPPGSVMEGILVECQNDRIPPGLLKVVHYRERLLISCEGSDTKPPQVRCLRKDFPKGIHQNLTGPNKPVDLCLSNQSWNDQKRTWNAILFLDRILWWMDNFAKNTIHGSDQPLEPPFFSRQTTIICPANIGAMKPDDYELVIMPSHSKEPVPSKIFLRVEKKDNQKQPPGKRFFFLSLECNCVEHGVINAPPTTLGELSVILKKLGIDVWPALKGEITRLFRENKDIPGDESRMFLLITFPQGEKRTGRLATFTFAFILDPGLGKIGLDNGFLSNLTDKNKKLTPCTIVGEEPANWKAIQIDLANVVMENTRAALAIYNNALDSEFDGVKPILIGCGSLGSHLLTQFFRMGFNDWVVIDNDHFLPHNIARHILINPYYGHPKVMATKHLLSHVSDEQGKGDFRFADASNIDWKTEFADRNLIIDASTTISIPRNLALNGAAPRCVSVFLSPSGRDSVLIAEDESRTTKLDALEAQYYKWIISGVGEDHLSSIPGIPYANGCRDISARIPVHHIFIHAGILASQLMHIAENKSATISIWQFQENTGTVTRDTLTPSIARIQTVGGWKVVYDEEIEKAAFETRKGRLPNETGGIILGYLDRVVNTIYLVVITRQPLDSNGSVTGFKRGMTGVEEMLNVVGTKTNGIVGYIGEWHSHPRGCCATPSSQDQTQLEWGSKKLEYFDQPAVMMIVSDDEISITLKTGQPS